MGRACLPPLQFVRARPLHIRVGYPQHWGIHTASVRTHLTSALGNTSAWQRSVHSLQHATQVYSTSDLV
jgi:hypothetical protein